jgi:hypothetical protein
MTVHTLDIALTNQVLVSKDKGGLQRHIAVEAFGSSPVGTLVLTAKAPGSGVFEAIPDGTIDLSAPTSVQVQGAISEINVNLAGVTGIDQIIVADTQRML